jgi:hypothetical protein
MHNEELFNFHFLPVIMMTVTSRKVILARHVARSGQERTAYRDSVGKHRHILEGNIKIYFREIRC